MNDTKKGYSQLMITFKGGRFLSRNGFFGYYAKIKGMGNKLIPIFGTQTKTTIKGK